MSIATTLRNGLFFIVLAFIMLTGCAGTKPEGSVATIPPEPGAQLAAVNWWAIRMQNEWPEGSAAEWYMDALIAHRIISPVHEIYRDRIFLWRFHRRAARDGAGHQFSYIFYSDAATAADVNNAIREDSLLTELQRAGRIRQVLTDDIGQITKPGIGDTSDQRWSPIVKNTWPYFIMGVSQTWLEMIETEAGQRETSLDHVSIETLQDQYRRIDDNVRKVWQSEGHHAFLHHLNAVFGYAPIIVGNDKLMKF